MLKIEILTIFNSLQIFILQPLLSEDTGFGTSEKSEGTCMYIVPELTCKIISLSQFKSILIIQSFYVGNLYLSETLIKGSHLGSRCNEINFSLNFVSVTITGGTPLFRENFLRSSAYSLNGSTSVFVTFTEVRPTFWGHFLWFLFVP